MLSAITSDSIKFKGADIDTAITTAGYGRLDINVSDVLKKYHASEDLLVSADTEITPLTGDWVKYKEIEIISPITPGSIFRVKFEIKGGGAGKVAHGQIYVNGVAVGTDQEWQFATYEIFSEDIPNLKVGDKVQLYAYVTGVGPGHLQHFRIYGKTIEFTTNLD